MTEAAREARLAAVVCGVLRQALLDSGARGIAVLRPDSAEGRLLRHWIERELADGSLVEAGSDDALVADPANKTTLLLEPPRSAAAVWPLGDLYASQVVRLAGAATCGPVVARLAQDCGGLEPLDRALQRRIEGRHDAVAAYHGLDTGAAGAVEAALDTNRFLRRRAALVPKLGTRTLGIDLFG